MSEFILLYKNVKRFSNEKEDQDSLLLCTCLPNKQQLNYEKLIILVLSRQKNKKIKTKKKTTRNTLNNRTFFFWKKKSNRVIRGGNFWHDPPTRHDTTRPEDKRVWVEVFDPPTRQPVNFAGRYRVDPSTRL